MLRRSANGILEASAIVPPSRPPVKSDVLLVLDLPMSANCSCGRFHLLESTGLSCDPARPEVFQMKDIMPRGCQLSAQSCQIVGGSAIVPLNLSWDERLVAFQLQMRAAIPEHNMLIKGTVATGTNQMGFEQHIFKPLVWGSESSRTAAVKVVVQAIPAYLNHTIRGTETTGFRLVGLPISPRTINASRDSALLTQDTKWRLELNIQQSALVYEQAITQKQTPFQLFSSIATMMGTTLGFWRILFMFCEAPILSFVAAIKSCWAGRRRRLELMRCTGEMEMKMDSADIKRENDFSEKTTRAEFELDLERKWISKEEFKQFQEEVRAAMLAKQDLTVCMQILCMYAVQVCIVHHCAVHCQADTNPRNEETCSGMIRLTAPFPLC